MSKSLQLTLLQGHKATIELKTPEPAPLRNLLLIGSYSNGNGGLVYIDVVSGSHYLVPNTVCIHTVDETASEVLGIPVGTKLTQVVGARYLDSVDEPDEALYGVYNGKWGFKPVTEPTEPTQDTQSTVEDF